MAMTVVTLHGGMVWEGGNLAVHVRGWAVQSARAFALAHVAVCQLLAM